jgi:hypothetical protein
MRWKPFGNAMVVLVKSLLVAWALFYLAEFFGWRLVREAGGNIV